MTLSLIVAVAENGAIGIRGGLPWRLSADLRRFRQLTMGHHIILGRKTHESIGRPLPGRIPIVVTRQRDYSCPAGLTAASLDEAIALAGDDAEPFVIGGAEIFRLALPQIERIYQTIVHCRPEGDVFFPAWDESAWRVVAEERHAADEKNSSDYTFRTLERKTPLPKRTMPDTTQQELLDVTARLLKSIADGDWKTYESLCDPSITAFEAEACGHLVEGMAFHRFYFPAEPNPSRGNTTLASPHVRLLGESGAVVSYVRLVQYLDDAGQAHTRWCEETRVWEKRHGEWKHVHFHRSKNG